MSALWLLRQESVKCKVSTAISELQRAKGKKTIRGTQITVTADIHRGMDPSGSPYTSGRQETHLLTMCRWGIWAQRGEVNCPRSQPGSATAGLTARMSAPETEGGRGGADGGAHLLWFIAPSFNRPCSANCQLGN